MCCCVQPLMADMRDTWEPPTLTTVPTTDGQLGVSRPSQVPRTPTDLDGTQCLVRLNEDTQGIEVNTCQQRGSITLCWSYSKGVLNYPRALCLTWGGSITQHHFTWAICQHEQPSCVPSVTQQRCCSLAEAGGGCSQSKPLATLGEAASLKWLVTLNSLNSLLEPYIYLIFHSQSRIWGIQFKDSLQQKWYAVLNVTHLDDAEQKCNAIYRKHRCKEELFYVLLWHSTLAAALLLNKYAWTIGGCTPSPGCELISRS